LGSARFRSQIGRFRLLNAACAVLDVEIGVEAPELLLVVAVIMSGGRLLLRRHFQNDIKGEICVLLTNDAWAHCPLGRLVRWMKERWLTSPEVPRPP
jgi:hypothetical protein